MAFGQALCGESRKYLSAPSETASSALALRVDALYVEIATKLSDVPTFNAYELLSNPASNAILVDVRSDAERAVSVIPGAIRLEQLAAAYQPQSRLVIVYCTVGYRSGLVARELRAKKIPARNLRGGILAWIAAGGTLVDGQNKQTNNVHVYAAHWAVVPANFSAQF
jgi:rhodanese-related sulfurtransferase